LSKVFSPSIEMIMSYFALISIYVLYYINWLMYVEPTILNWNETNFTMVYDTFNVMLNSFASSLLRIFVSLFIREFNLIFFFFCVFTWFCNQDVWLAS
jgi:hypothetical protein